VIRPVDPAVFICDFLGAFLEGQLYDGSISTHEYHSQLADLRKNKKLAILSQRLFDSSPNAVNFSSYGPLRIIYLREPDGAEFPFLQGLTKIRPLQRPEKLVCFVGHRFLVNIEKSLRFNLVHLFEPHEIILRWSGYDLSAKDVFEDIETGIRTADLCIFDNLGTLNRPNVYIEIGIAHALARPMLVCEYVGPSSKGRRKIPDTDSVPSDLQGLLRIQYKSYEDLCRQLYFGLPRFLQRHHLS
jgi:hypothetical protein